VQQVTVRVPASTSNLGPGFDCLGVALRLYNEVTIKRSANSRQIPIVREVAAAFFRKTRCQRFDFSCVIAGGVPIARGLGSSATIRIGSLLALNEIARTHLTRRDIFAIAVALEKHPDNVAPATFGGFTVTRGPQVQRFTVASDLLFVLLISPIKVATKKARALLPERISHADAVRSAGAAAAITAAFVSRGYENLRGNFWDGLHQPYRAKLIPHLDDCIKAAEGAGALGAFLSGSGSAICAIALRNGGKIAAAMQATFGSNDARTIITRADNSGARIVEARSR
jgi:homoserine kinase